MRIIDKNMDFYDYLQNVYIDKSIVFDRTDSYLLTKEIMCDALKRRGDQRYNFLLLQVCNTFWLFLIEILEMTDWYMPTKYSIELITNWKNYHKDRKLIDLSVIDFNLSVDHELRKGFFGDYDKSKIMSKQEILIQAVNNGDFKVYKCIDSHTVYYGSGAGATKAAKHLPLLKACGVADFIDPLEIFLAFEEYFSLEKSSNERTESIGLTDTEKIGNHGFDKKKSFRNIKN
jgi:hypothetical protein